MLKRIIFIIVILVMVFSQVAYAYDDIYYEIEDNQLVMKNFKKDSDEFINDTFKRLINFVSGISGVAILTMLLVFVINFIMLATSSGNPQQRRNAMIGLIVSGIATAILGGVTLFAGIFYSM